MIRLLPPALVGRACEQRYRKGRFGPCATLCMRENGVPNFPDPDADAKGQFGHVQQDQDRAGVGRRPGLAAFPARAADLRQADRRPVRSEARRRVGERQGQRVRAALPTAGERARRWPLRWSGRAIAVLALLLVVAGAVVAVTNPFSSKGPGGGAADNSTATSLQTVTRQALSSQTQVDGTLGYADYAGSSSVAVPSGTAPSDVQKAQQTVTSAQAALQAAQTALAADERTLAQAQATLAADRLKVRSVCGGDNAATASSSDSSSNQNPGSGSSPCQSAAQAVTTDQQSVSTAQGKVTTDQGQVASAQASLTAAEQSLSTANASATVYDAGATYTMLPEPGDVIRRGQTLYAVNGTPVLLLYGPVAAWRAFRAGMSPGRDVAELNASLQALGYGRGLGGDSFTSGTEQAIGALQAAHGLDRTGGLALGSVVFEPGPVRVTSVTPTVGATVQAGAVLSVTSTHHQVVIELDASQQSEVKAGDPVTITLPDNSTTPGVVAKVGKVATTPSSGDQGGSSTPTIEVDVKLSHERAAGQLDQAPVQVSITTASVKSALVVSVNALLALAGGGYAVEVVDPSGVHHLVGVTTGLFDDAEGLVEVNGTGLKVGQRVVVPSSSAVVSAVRRVRLECSSGEVEKTYGSDPPILALRGVSFRVDAGELAAIVGPSGSGKSTLLHLMGTLERPSSGRVSITGLDVGCAHRPGAGGGAATRIGFVFQQFFLAEHSTVLENVADGLLYAGVPVAERRERAAEALAAVGLGERVGARPTQLSGGSGSGSRSRAPSSAGRRSCSPTSRQGIWTAPRARRSWPCSTSCTPRARRSW